MPCLLLLCFVSIFRVVHTETTTKQAARCIFDWNISNLQQETMTVVWSGDGDGNATLTLTEICSHSSCSQFRVTKNFSQKSAELKPCSNNTKYEVEILYFCPYSNEKKKNKTIWTPAALPAAPFNLSASFTNTSICLEWKEPEPFAGPIVNYTVWCDVCPNKEINTTSKFLSITDLHPYKEHKLKIRAYITDGPGVWSQEVVVRTDIGVPNKPGNITEMDVTSENMTLKWEEPFPSTGPIQEYFVYFSKPLPYTVTRRTTEKFFIFKGLSPSTSYYVSVAAATSAGIGYQTGRWVNSSSGAPGPPIVGVDGTQNTSITVSWKLPFFYMTRRPTFSLRWRSIGGSYTIRKMNKTPSLYTIMELAPCTLYEIQMRSRSSWVDGRWSEIQVVQTETGVPSAAIFKDITLLEGRSVRIDWMTRGHYPGPFNYTLRTWKLPIPCSNQSSEYQVNEITNAKSRDQWNELHSDIISGLSPFGEYWFEIILFTSVTEEVRSEKSKEIQIAAEAAEEPMNVTADCRSSPTEVRISWKPPKEYKGIIDRYVVQYSMQDVHLCKEFRVANMCDEQSVMLSGLRPERSYDIRVSARVQGVEANGKQARLEEECILPAGVPYLGNASQVRAGGSGPHHLVLEWTEDTFSNYMGHLVRYAVLVGKKKSLGNAIGGKVAEESPTWSSFKDGDSNFYQATPQLWNPFRDGPDPLGCFSFNVSESNKTVLRCFIGIQTTCLENERYCNGPLEPDTQYELKIRGFTEGGYNETDPVKTTTGLPPKESPSSVVKETSVSVVSFLLLCILAVSFYVMVRVRYLKTLTKVIQPVKCKDFEAHIEIMMSDSNLKFSQEFERLNNESPHLPCVVGEMEENNSKNRCAFLIPFDQSRVKLLPLCDEPGSDFINANYIPGFSSPREYIASQGPLLNTVDDFWRMIWEQSIRMVVMLTQCFERDLRRYKKKCEQYWPDSGESNLYGDLRVTCVSEAVLSTYVIRIFNVHLVIDTGHGCDSYERQVKQMQFTHWPDFGCPESPEYLIDFMRAVRDHLPREENAPMLVHCSAGVGRTGTFIAVDKLCQHLYAASNNSDDDTVDIYATVLELRNHRIKMVQTEDQYIYVYLCVNQLIQQRDEPRLEVSEELV